LRVATTDRALNLTFRRRVLRGHEESVEAAAFSPAGRGSLPLWDGTARIWDAATGKEIAVLRGHENVVLFAAFTPDGHFLDLPMLFLIIALGATQPTTWTLFFVGSLAALPSRPC
jgi:WD40 repeat protein